MADSDNSRTLPSNRYRNLLAVTADILSEMVGEGHGAYGRHTAATLEKWSAWSRAHSDYCRLCRVQQQLEGRLFRTTARQENRPLATPVIRAESEVGEKDAAGTMPASNPPNLSSSENKREVDDLAADHRRATAAEDAASVRAQRLAAELCSQPGNSAVSAMAKLHCLIEQGEPAPDCAEFPWPQIRSALADLLMATTPETACGAPGLLSGARGQIF